MKKKENIYEAFSVKNNLTGRRTIALTKEIFKNSPFKVIVRGRDKNRRKAIERAGLTYTAAHRRDIPAALAANLAVYIIHKKSGIHLKHFSVDRVIN